MEQATKNPHIPQPFSEESLEEGVERILRTMRFLSDSGVVAMNDLVLPGASRHLVVRNQDGTLVAKSYADAVRWRSERDNLEKFTHIANSRGTIFNEVTQSDLPYIQLPTIHETVVDRLSSFDLVTGDLLYDKVLGGTATFDDFVLAAVQVARIQQEGKINRTYLNLEDVIRRQQGDENYFMQRFEGVFKSQLMRHGGISIHDNTLEEMRRDWNVLVAQNLTKAQYAGHNGYYFDGNPRHHILPAGGGIVSFDFEDKIIVPSLLGIASLLSFGLTDKEGKPYIAKEQQYQILDRVALELEFVEALRQGAKDRAERIFRYVKERYDSGVHDLADGDKFLRFMGGHNDVELGRKYREEFLGGWPYALLDRSTAWLGHKARYRAIIPLLEEKGIKLQMENPEQQYAAEQRGHITTILGVLEELKNMPTRNGHQLQNGAYRLHNRFSELYTTPSNEAYFNPR